MVGRPGDGLVQQALQHGVAAVGFGGSVKLQEQRGQQRAYGAPGIRGKAGLAFAELQGFAVGGDFDVAVAHEDVQAFLVVAHGSGGEELFGVHRYAVGPGQVLQRRGGDGAHAAGADEQALASAQGLQGGLAGGAKRPGGGDFDGAEPGEEVAAVVTLHVQPGAAHTDGGGGGGEADVAVVGFGDEPGQGAYRAAQQGDEEFAFGCVFFVIDEAVHAKAGGSAQGEAAVVAKGEYAARGAAGLYGLARVDGGTVYQAAARTTAVHGHDFALGAYEFGAGLYGVGVGFLRYFGRFAGAFALADAGIEVGAADADGGGLGLESGGIRGVFGDQSGDGAQAAREELHDHAVVGRTFPVLELLDHHVGARAQGHAGAVLQPDDGR